MHANTTKAEMRIIIHSLQKDKEELLNLFKFCEKNIRNMYSMNIDEFKKEIKPKLLKFDYAEKVKTNKY